MLKSQSEMAMMRFQRDKPSLDALTRLCKSGSRCLLFWLRRQPEALQWQQILLSDSLRVLGNYQTSINIGERVSKNALSNKHHFWALHVVATSKQYMGDYDEAISLFIQSQAFATELYLSFSYQHLGKLYVEQGRLKEAEVLLNDALNIRRKYDKPLLESSTLKALQGLEELRKNSTRNVYEP
ncbi:Tetratricopeptide repeat protein [Vibrio owensii]|uniref:tetratricopeptide repeat protein n=1 Tax=Vibrio owensii TaxID=696485 RepID=UPI002893976F|nr:Tetratricopeptide repeat protein [Vibrio owensii]CAH1548254.1 Tetratricopeptide repeat protein [Vibrio owensii]